MKRKPFALLFFSTFFWVVGLDRCAVAAMEPPSSAAPAGVVTQKNPFEEIESAPYTVVAGDSLYKIAKEYRTTVGLLKRLNGLEGDTIYAGTELKVPRGIFGIEVDISDYVLRLLFNGRLVKEYPVATGKGMQESTPVGTFKITNKLENPTWYRAGAVLPPGSPENALGSRWLGFDLAGYGIHGTIEPETIGQAVTAGCIRMHNQDVEEIDSLVPIGTQVIVSE